MSNEKTTKPKGQKEGDLQDRIVRHIATLREKAQGLADWSQSYEDYAEVGDRISYLRETADELQSMILPNAESIHGGKEPES